ncbi:MULTISPECIES: maleylpyruvate isomerase family mycothiol-dependent enzyme [unclassified Rhodococcus (in: high G+C Gram-positive bacteria)]|uniref:maleylpyruvate isomerase family mycothiol-dependent enzyme n=1 Tax=unclassified Rhodococcus (in: high G+C Gram-positive bacteria) TaxID=192944 RepID=UPI001BB3F1AB|nr:MULTISPECIES: maleylpyruvate isomerase family mycothiol-dependent enzyme [unclassified Rhodococcus (in: high G+C Gram-positive bacteria)]
MPSILPGWSRRHVVAHVAANADALGNLVQWARTGVESPMYASPDDRSRGIEEGATLTTPELVSWICASATTLAHAMEELSDSQWDKSVCTAQGRVVPATEVPWMRSREVCVHAVDLAVGIGFDELGVDFLRALGDDIVAKRHTSPAVALALEVDDDSSRWELDGPGEAQTVTQSLADTVAYLSGRLLRQRPAGAANPRVPVLPTWL